jgi:ABC-type transport system substrate-binding protein
MKRFVWRWLAVNSLLMLALAGRAETRPQYGGTLRVTMRTAPTSLDPAENGQTDSFARRNLTLLIFDTLVATDDSGRARGALAVSWQASPTNQRWQFHLHRGVKFQDGTALTPESVAASLRAGNPTWNVSVDGDSVVIERDIADPEMLGELALPRNAIAKRNSVGNPSGTGPFHIVDWQPGKKLTLAAEEGYWRGRPFLDGIEIEMGRSFRDQMTALELGRADLVEIAPEQSHRVSLDSRRLANSAPMELLALLFTRDALTPEEKSLREALAWSVERGSIRSVLLQGAGQSVAGVLPAWMSGYGFIFSTDADLARARHAREQVRTIPTWTVGYDSGDAVAQLLAERVALNGRDAGLVLQPTSASTADLRLVRIPLASADPWITLAGVASVVGAPGPKNEGGSVEDLYAAEQAMLATQRIIPLFHLPLTYAASASLKNWTLRPDGSWNLADAWLGNGKP